jgi:hypothetical protein
MMNRKIIRVAWIVKNPLKPWESVTWRPGFASSARTAIAARPPITKKKNVVARYWTPITL